MTNKVQSGSVMMGKFSNESIEGRATGMERTHEVVA